MAVALLFAAASRIAGAEAPGEFARFDWFEYRGADPIDAIATADARHYRNPILAGFYPDPSIERVGEDYYLVNSSFAYFPGIPLFHSRDLVTWTQIGNVIDRPGQFAFGAIGLSRGIFAPDITYHRGVFYLVSTCIDCGGNFVLTATDPAGPWSDPVWVDIDGIDPALFFDDDGSAWILNNGPPVGTPLYDGHRAIWIQRFDERALQPVGPRTLLINGGVDLAARPIWAEGPHLFRKDGWYYLITAEGGTAEQHAEVVYRSRDVTGPYRPGPGNPILTQRDLDPARPHPITSAGHADFVTTPAGDWWSVFLGARPYRDNYYNIGRETFLLPVKWTRRLAHDHAAGQRDSVSRGAPRFADAGRDRHADPRRIRDTRRVRRTGTCAAVAADSDARCAVARPRDRTRHADPAGAAGAARRPRTAFVLRAAAAASLGNGAGSCALRADVARRSGWHRNRAERESLLCADAGG